MRTILSCVFELSCDVLSFYACLNSDITSCCSFISLDFSVIHSAIVLDAAIYNVFLQKGLMQQYSNNYIFLLQISRTILCTISRKFNKVLYHDLCPFWLVIRQYVSSIAHHDLLEGAANLSIVASHFIVQLPHFPLCLQKVVLLGPFQLSHEVLSEWCPHN